MKKTVIIGNIGQDAQVRQTQTGQQFVSLTVAVSEKIKGQETTTWFNCSGWGERFTGTLLQYLRKGTKVYIEGNYTPSIFQRQDGTMDISHNLMVNQIELLSSVQQATQQAQPVANAAQPVGQPIGQPVGQPQYQQPVAQPVQQQYQQPIAQPVGQPQYQQPVQQQWAAPSVPGSGHKDDNLDDVPF